MSTELSVYVHRVLYSGMDVIHMCEVYSCVAHTCDLSTRTAKAGQSFQEQPEVHETLKYEYIYLYICTYTHMYLRPHVYNDICAHTLVFA